MNEAAIIKHLEAVCASGRKAWDVYEDWLDMTVATLEAMPRHAESVAQHGTPAEDIPETAALWARLRGTYSASDFVHLRDAFQKLLFLAEQRVAGWIDDTAVDGQTWDVLGSVYMQLNVWSGHSGQYFTPWSIARVMAQFTLTDIDAMCRHRVAAAIDAGPMGVMGLASGASITQPGKETIMLAALVDNYAHLEPVTVNDPACGSGVMLLAAAATCPKWAIDYNVVRFFGQDIDRTCVKMARANMMLYGLNGYNVRLTLAAQGVAAKLPPPPAAEPLPPTIPDATLPAGQMELFA